jgi:hypothetical protein
MVQIFSVRRTFKHWCTGGAKILQFWRAPAHAGVDLAAGVLGAMTGK